jgi:hypothetical protein
MKYLRSTTVFLILIMATSIFAAPDWEAVIYPSGGVTYYGYVTIDSIPIQTDDLLGAFVDGECRMVANPVANPEGLVAGVTLNGPGGATQTVQFRVWDASNDFICDVVETYEVTFDGSNYFQDLNAITYPITDTEISIEDAAVNQVTSFSVEISSYQGIASSWDIEEIEFEIHFADSLIERQ